MLHLHYGGPVTGNQRFPRPDLEQAMLRFIEHGSGVKMFGLRRTGKSTLLRFAEGEMKNRGFTVVPVDAQGMRSIDSLLFGVFNALSENHKGIIEKIYHFFGTDTAVPAVVRKAFDLFRNGKSDSGTESAISEYWPHFSRHIVRVLLEDQPQLLLSIDELPFMVQNMIKDHPENGPREVDQLLAALREWRNAGLKMIVAGSIGMAGLARKHGFLDEHLNDLSPLDIPELSEEAARAFVREAVDTFANRKWTEAHTKVFFEEIGALYPCFLVKSLITLKPEAPPSPGDFPEIFSMRIRPELHNTFLQQFDRRFRFYAEIDAKFRRERVLPILTAVLAKPDGMEQMEISFKEPCEPIELREALSLLNEDGFLSFSEGRDGCRIWRPASRLVLLWGRRTIL